MSGITLSSSVRQNLLSLQSTADLLSTTQNRLATGNKVNSALDNPTNFFTAQGLNNRASDINNLLDGIGNGVQILQAANTGITSLQKLVDSAKSIANQALQATTGYSTKSQVTTAAVTGATASNLLGGTATAATNAKVTSTVDLDTASVDASGGDKTFSINGDAVTLTAAGGASGVYDTAALALAINTQVGASAKVNATVDTNGKLLVTSTDTAGSGNTITVTGADKDAVFGVGTTPVAGAAASTTGGLSGLTLKIAATDGGQDVDITFGAGSANINEKTGVATNINTLDDLNKVLAVNNAQASLSSDGKLTITTTNDHAASTLGAFTGTATGSGNALGAITIGAPAADANAQNTRANLVAQYNTVIDQIKTTASDSSFNGVNLLGGDTLALTFNERGTSKLNITGVNFDPAGLGLASLTKGSDFLDNAGTNKLLTTLNNASSSLRSQASAFGSNLSVVQLRQDFSKNLINVLQTGASNLTLADTNEEAANSQALSTRQSIAVSALSLANQSQQGVLQLLR